MADEAPWEKVDGADEADSPWFDGGLAGDFKGDPTIGGGASLRFWMPAGAEKTIIFLTNGEDFKIQWEHNPPLNGGFKNWTTCLEMLKVKCPICELANAGHAKSARYKAVYCTVIDLSEYTDKGGKVHKNERKLLMAKQESAELLARKWLNRKEAKQNLRGAKFKVFRSTKEKSASIGTDFEFIEMVDLAALPDSNELDYKELIGPDPAKAKLVAARIAASAGMGVAGSAGGTSDSVKY